MKKKHLLALLFTAVLLAVTSVSAQVAPDAGTLRQEIEKQRAAVEPKKAAPAEISSATASSPSVTTSASVTVTSFVFNGNKLLSEKELSAALVGFLNKPLGFAELQTAAVTVAETYRRAGWIVRAYLPLQDVSNGTVTINIIEAVFGETRFDGDPPERISFERLESMVAAQQEADGPLNAARLDRALLLISDLPGFTTSANLAVGKHERETDLVLKIHDDSLFSGELTVDNTGSRFTGENRVTGTLFGNSLFHIGDQLSTTLLHAQGVNYGQLTATAPLGYSGWRLGPHVSYLKYDLIASEFAALDIQGTSTAMGLDATYPLIRARAKNLYFSFTYDNARFNNEANNVITTHYKVTTLEAGLKGHRFDNFFGGGINAAALTFTSGKVDLNDSPNKLTDAATTQVNGGFNKLRYFASRQQHLTDYISLYVGVSGQLTNRNLDSSEKFYLGGASSVRAYPASEAGGDQGVLANVEARMRLPHSFSVTGFYDRGQITVNRNNNFLGEATLNSYSLQGAGLSVGWVSDFPLSIKATVARRIGNNPRATANGNDQDGTLKKTRFWLQASMSF